MKAPKKWPMPKKDIYEVVRYIKENFCWQGDREETIEVTTFLRTVCWMSEDYDLIEDCTYLLSIALTIYNTGINFDTRELFQNEDKLNFEAIDLDVDKISYSYNIENSFDPRVEELFLEENENVTY